MAQDGKTKFIRKGGKIIPIKGKDSGKSKAKSKKKMSKKQFASKALSSSAKKDRKLAKQGRKVGNVSFGVAGVAGITALATKGKRGLLTGLLSGTFGMLNKGFAEGRKTSATIKEQGSSEILGKKIKGKRPAAIGEAAHRAQRQVRAAKKFVKSSKKRRK